VLKELEAEAALEDCCALIKSNQCRAVCGRVLACLADLGERRPSRLVATAAEDHLTFQRSVGSLTARFRHPCGRGLRNRAAGGARATDR
jgi:hypothetical protein